MHFFILYHVFSCFLRIHLNILILLTCYFLIAHHSILYNIAGPITVLETFTLTWGILQSHYSWCVSPISISFTLLYVVIHILFDLFILMNFLSKIKKGLNLWYLMTIQFYKACIFVVLRLCLFGRKGREEKRKEKRRERKKKG